MPEETTSVSIFNPKNGLYPFQRKVILSEEKRKEVENDLGEIYTKWDSNSANLKTLLRRWLNDSEGISDPITSPWEGASDIVRPIVETRMNIIHSFFMSIIRPMVGRLFTCVVENTSDAEERKLSKDLAQFFNTNRQFNKMYVDSADESFWAVLRDGTVGRTCVWLKEPEKTWEVVTFNSIEEFTGRFPVPEAAGVSNEKYLEFIGKLQAGETLSLDIEFERLTIDRPDIDTQELKDIVVYPLTVSRQSRTRFLGIRMYKRASELKWMEKQKIYDNVDEVIKTTPIKSQDTIKDDQNRIEGITEPEETEDYELIHGRYLKDLDDDGIEEKYLVTYDVNSKKYIQFDKYPFYHNDDFLKLSWFKRRVKRIFGRGVAQMLGDMQMEASIQARQRINSRSITDQPMFVFNESLKAQLDPRRPENRFKPGGGWWVPEMKMDKVAKPVEVAKRDFGDSLNEESLLNSIADNVLGASELRSGRETPHDPRAPAAKTALLLQQSSIRLDDFINMFIQKENEILDMAKKLYYQFGAEKLTFNVEEGSKLTQKELSKSIFNSDSIHLQLTITSLLDNPEFLKEQWEDFYAKYSGEPLLGAIPSVRWEILNEIILNRPETHGRQLLLPLEQIQQQAQAAPPAATGETGGGATGLHTGMQNILAGGKRL